LAAVVVAFPSWGAGAPFDRIVVFGTSLSDPGNDFALHQINLTPPYLVLIDPLTLVPHASYAAGGHHWSNGATWIEQLARPLGLEGSVGAAFGSQGVATNYAVGGARAYNDGVNVDLQEQVLQFTNDFAGVAPDGALYVIEMGGNDVRDALLLYLGGDVNGANQILQQALTSIEVELATLYQMGARRFLIWNVPDLSLTPAARRLDLAAGTGTAIRDLVRLLAQGFNLQLSLIVTNFQQLPGADVKVFDAFKGTNDIVDNASEFGLSNVQDACIMPGVAPFKCQGTDQFLFWDGIHPTKSGHAIIGQQAAAALGL
jgi:phospholipase/lecithinase/hemolysin